MINQLFWRAAVASGGASAQAVSGFTTTGTGSYYGRSDSGVALAAESTDTKIAAFTLDALSASRRRIFSKGDGGTSGWSLSISASNVLEYSDSQTTTLAYTFDGDDVGSTFIIGVSRSPTIGRFMYAYRVGDDSIRLLDYDSATTSAPATTTQSVAIGALRGDSTGGEEATSLSILGCGFYSDYKDRAAMETLLKACAAANTVVTAANAVSVYKAPALETDTVGSNDLTKVENTPGDLVASAVTPSYRNAGTYRLWLWIGQSNARGQLPTAEVPNYTSGTDYTASYSSAKLYSEHQGAIWEDLQPQADDYWAGELSFGRNLVTNGETLPHILKHAIGGTSAHTDWAPDPIGTSLNTFETAYFQATEFKVGSERSYHAFAVPEIAGIYWDQGESDGGSGSSQPIADAYEANELDIIEYFTGGTYPLASDFVWVSTLLPSFQDDGGFVPYRSTINAGKAANAAARSDVVTVNTDNASDEGDFLHRGPGSFIQAGIAAEAAWRLGANQTMAAPQAPAISSATVASDGAAITVVVDSSTAQEAITGSDWTLSNGVTVSSGAWSNATTLVLTLAESIYPGETITLDVKPSVFSAGGAVNVRIEAQAVTNNAAFPADVLAIYAADDVTTSGSEITVFADQSGNANPSVDAGAGNRPTLDTSTYPINVADFDGTEWTVIATAVCSALTGTTDHPFSMGMSIRPTSTLKVFAQVGASDTDYVMRYTIQGSTTRRGRRRAGGESKESTTSAGYTDSAWQTEEMHCDGTTAQHLVDGSDVTSASDLDLTTTPASSTQGFIGKSVGGSNYIGQMAAWYIADAELTAAGKSMMRRWLDTYTTAAAA